MSKCVHCNVLKFLGEAPGMCCSAGKVRLPPFSPLPEPLCSLIMGVHNDHMHFIHRVRNYNSCFQMTSFGAKQMKGDGFMPTLKEQGPIFHLIGSLQPLPEEDPRFLQIYFVGEDEREARIRCNNFPGARSGEATTEDAALQ